MISRRELIDVIDSKYGKCLEIINTANEDLMNANWARSRQINILSGALGAVELILLKYPKESWEERIRAQLLECNEALQKVNLAEAK
jgi:hypothetical protein